MLGARKKDAGTSETTAINPLRNLGIQEDEDVKKMLQGSSIVKVRSPHRQKRRTLRLLEDGVTIWCQSHKSSSRTKEQQSFSIMDVECVREGCQLETVRHKMGSESTKRGLTVVFKGPRKSLVLLCQSEEEAQQWVRGIRTLQERMDNMTHKEKLDHWIHAYLSRADENHDDKMSYEEVQKLLRMINVDQSDQYARSLFQKCDHSADGHLDHEEIEVFCKELLKRPELDTIFIQHSANGFMLSTDDLRDFLKEQEEDCSVTHAQSLILTYELNKWAQKNHLMTPNGFTMYMLSKHNCVFNPDHAWVYQDMTQPLAHYFISSSHKTYLTKEQMTRNSSTEPYIRALSHGCRCVELDCWDGDGGEPVIYHGHILTSKVPFVEVIKIINEFAFKASPFPLILSLENHCSVEQQAVMARHLRSILGEKLLQRPLSTEKSKCLPSPEDLKGKILVKGKREESAEECLSSSSDLNSSDDETSVAEGRSKKKKDGKKAGVSKLSPELSELVVYTRSVHFKGFDQAAKNSPYQMSSFSEREALKLIKDSGVLFVRHNSHKLSRIYPSGRRLLASNYNPQQMWNAGCQIVALNFQTPGEQMDLNQGRFLQNGLCGYVLKPPFMCKPDSTFNPENVGGGPGHRPILLTIRVISAQQLPKPEREKPSCIVDPQVWVEIHGVPIDNNKQKTHYVKKNGLNPQWNCTLNFTVRVPDLALVRFMVEDHDYTSSNDFLGQYTLPFTSIRSGYRHVPLFKLDGSSLSPSTLFIHVKFSTCQSTLSRS
ncbi:1-phosphatidylinositol 4,5-bisphosphate phosphodiesterase delta-3-A-like [Oryzias latipes]|uniref:1-phosphatidylinositol 4,5-bisphosphate phosphodiesterase delta-3-A-like n=1 Tax=Oryzias latipes TaxID=8090 RepID=UPI0002A48B09|nr:1-phosphatidylinositol 4,5-bisphosphate phosphodiesterase delta-3-A-like [Oryzias latipes]